MGENSHVESVRRDLDDICVLAILMLKTIIHTERTVLLKYLKIYLDKSENKLYWTGK